jgi:membrane-associated protease RseP (regulator of RpoE activity)
MKTLVGPRAAIVYFSLLLLVFAVVGATQAKSDASEKKAWLGVQLQALNDDLKEALEMDEDADGVLIAEVLDDSPADEAGLEDGDVVTAIDGDKMGSVKELVAAIGDRSPGDEVKIDIVRDGRRRTVTVELGESEMAYKMERIRMPDLSRIGDDVNQWVQAWDEERGYLGVSILDLNDDLGQYFKVKEGEGVLITDVAEDSPAEEAGLMAGDVVLEYDGKMVKNTEKFRKYVAGTEPGEEVSVVVKRKGRNKTVEVEVGEMDSPMGQFLGNFRSPTRGGTCGRMVIRGDDGEVKVYGLPGGKGSNICTPGARGHKIVIEGLEDLEDLDELELHHMEGIGSLDKLEEEIEQLQKEMKELRRELEKLSE